MTKLQNLRLLRKYMEKDKKKEGKKEKLRRNIATVLLPLKSLLIQV